MTPSNWWYTDKKCPRFFLSKFYQFAFTSHNNDNIQKRCSELYAGFQRPIRNEKNEGRGSFSMGNSWMGHLNHWENKKGKEERYSRMGSEQRVALWSDRIRPLQSYVASIYPIGCRLLMEFRTIIWNGDSPKWWSLVSGYKITHRIAKFHCTYPRFENEFQKLWIRSTQCQHFTTIRVSNIYKNKSLNFV